jgi:hypothetical protein
LRGFEKGNVGRKKLEEAKGEGRSVETLYRKRHNNASLIRHHTLGLKTAERVWPPDNRELRVGGEKQSLRSSVVVVFFAKFLFYFNESKLSPHRPTHKACRNISSN